MVYALVGEAFNRLDPTAERVMQALAVFNRPVTPAAVDYLLQPYLPNIDSAGVLNRLASMQFARKDAGRFYLHSVDREYAFARVPRGTEEDRTDWFSEYSKIAAELLSASPEVVEGIQNLQAENPQIGEISMKIMSDGAIQISVRNQDSAQLMQDFFAAHPEITEKFQKVVHSSFEATMELREHPRLTQFALLYRAANYFAQTRKPREAWKTLADLEPQLNEFNLRCAAEDYDKAASVLLEIDFDYLLLWGHYRLMIEMHEKLQGKIGDQDLSMRNVHNLGSAYAMIGEIQKAIIRQEQALTIARDKKDKGAEGAILGNLGNRYSELGETRRAITFYKQALAIAHEIGDKPSQGVSHANLGNAYSNLGETHRAIEFHEQALAITHEIGDMRVEGLDNRFLAYALIDEQRYAEATQRAVECIRIGEEISNAQIGSEGNYTLALAHLYMGNLPAACAAAETARKYDVPQNNHNVLVLLGIIALRQNDNVAAQEAFSAAIAHADVMLERSAQNFDALDAKGVALCGLGLGSDNGQERIKRTEEAVAALRRRGSHRR